MNGDRMLPCADAYDWGWFGEEGLVLGEVAHAQCSRHDDETKRLCMNESLR